jgi:small subunit ribosomal protein S6
MSRKYTGTIVINTQGIEENAATLVQKIGRELETNGAKLEQVDEMGRRAFPYGSKKQTHGYFAVYHFQAAPDVLEKIQGKLRLNPDVHQQFYVVK